MPNSELAHVNPGINGMVNIVKNLTLARMVESGIQPINNVSALINHIGVDIVAYQSLSVLVANISIQLFQNVYVCPDSNGTVKFVFNATMVEHGM